VEQLQKWLPTRGFLTPKKYRSHKNKGKEELAENNTRGRLGSWEDKGKN
jgi:hypothetical protein